MPDPKMLYAVTAIVFAALAAWVFVVFRNAKEPWARPIGDLPDDATPPATPKAKKGSDDKKADPKKAEPKKDDAKAEPKKDDAKAAEDDEDEDEDEDEKKS